MEGDCTVILNRKNRDVSTGPLAPPFACSLAPLTRSLALDCSLRSRPPLRSLVRSLAHFAHSLAHFAQSLARGTVKDEMAILCFFLFSTIAGWRDRLTDALTNGRTSSALWSGTNKNRDVSTGPLARPFARSLAPLTRSLAPDCSLR